MNKKTILIISMLVLLTACVNPAFNAIKGKRSDDVSEKMGQPTTKLKENGFEMWTYRNGPCTQIVFFDADGLASGWQEIGVCTPKE